MGPLFRRCWSALLFILSGRALWTGSLSSELDGKEHFHGRSVAVQLSWPRIMNVRKRELILLVEDDADDEIMALRFFRQGQVHAEVVVVRDGAEALDYLFGIGVHAQRDVSQMPAHIMLDMYLPRMNGLEVLQRIKSDERTKTIPVTMLTGSDYDVVTNEMLRQGAAACIMKPLTAADLRRIAGPNGSA
jgi:two-component system response regulator